MDVSAIAGFITLCNSVIQLGRSLLSDQPSTDEERILEVMHNLPSK